MRAALRKKFGKDLKERRRELAATFKRNQEAKGARVFTGTESKP